MRNSLRAMPYGLLSGLTAYFPLHEASGTRFGLVGVGNLTDVNTVTQSVVAPQGVCAFFTRANSEQLTLADSTPIKTGDIDFTISCWVRLTSVPAAVMSFVSKYAAGAGNSEYFVFYDSTISRLAFSVYRATDSQQTVAANPIGVPSTGVWYHIIAWHDSNANTIYIDVNHTGVTSNALAGNLQASGTGGFAIGGTSIGLHHDGEIGEVGLWKRVLSPAERAWLYNSGKGRTYPFDGGASPMMLGIEERNSGLRKALSVGVML